MLTGIIVAAIVVGCVGIILGFFLGISGEKFKVEVDPREEAILEVLPGTTVVAAATQVVPVLPLQSPRVRLRSDSVRSVVIRLLQKSARSWVSLLALR